MYLETGRPLLHELLTLHATAWRGGLPSMTVERAAILLVGKRFAIAAAPTHRISSSHCIRFVTSTAGNAGLHSTSTCTVALICL